MKKIFTILLACVIMVCGAIGFSACNGEKNITVGAREQGSGTREAFDKVVTDGNGNFLEMSVDGKKTYKTTANVGYSWGIIRVGSLLPTRFSFPHAILMRFNTNRIVAN